MRPTTLSSTQAVPIPSDERGPAWASWPGRLRTIMCMKGGRGIKVVMLTTGLWVAVGLVSFLHTLWLGVGDSRLALNLSLLEWGPWIVVSPFVVVLAAAAPIAPKNWKWTIPLHLAVSLGVAVGLNSLNRGVARRTPPAVAAQERIEGPRPALIAPARVGFGGPRPAGGLPPRAPLSAAALLNARLTLPIYWLIVAAVLAWRHHRVALEREGRAVRAEREAVRARLAALQAQLQPHFLFNSLNAITAFIHRRPAAAENMVCALSTLLRRVLHAAERPEIPMAEELDFVRDYLAVHRIRFEDTLSVKWDLDPAADDALVPTLILQPLIENALEHGLRGAAGEITLRTRVQDARLVLTVTDEAAQPPPTGYAPPPSPRVGLRNTRERLETLFGSDHRLHLEVRPHGASAEIQIPLRTTTS